MANLTTTSPTNSPIVRGVPWDQTRPSDDVEQTAHAYGPNTARLLAVKQRLDPDGVFAAIPLPRSNGRGDE